MDVVACIERADIEELQYRIDSLSKVPQTLKSYQRISISKALSVDENSFNKLENTSTVAHVNTKNDTTITQSIKEEEASLLAIRQIFKEIELTVHEVLDTIAPVSLNKLDSLICLQFKNKGIQANYYYSEWVDLQNDSVLNTSAGLQTATGEKQSFIYKYNKEKNLGYRIYTEPLFKTVIIEMKGILSTTLLILIILSFSFWYLIRTVLQQRTLDEMKDDFTNNMTHELKTPIAVSYSAIDALLNFNAGDDKEKRIKYLKICEEQLSKLSILVEQILSISMERRKLLVLNKEEILLKNEIIDPLIDQFKLKSKKEISFQSNIQPPNLKIKADRMHLSNILSNLIDNAINYSGNQVQIDLNCVLADDVCEIKITDNGMGIPYEKQRYIFDKFYRVGEGNQHNMKGYGLGLFYVKTLIEKHGGSIQVNSAIGKGSCFTLTIPAL